MREYLVIGFLIVFSSPAVAYIGPGAGLGVVAGMLAFILPGFEGASPANVLQEGLCERQDVLTFVTSPLELPMLIAGQISVNLEISSSAPDTAFTAKLIEVFVDGSAVNIRDNINKTIS